MNFEETVAKILDPAPMPFEMGYERMPDGSLHVAARTDLHGCTGKMFEWWFQFAPDTRQYAWWHPGDHVTSVWANQRPGTHIGSEHLVEERFGALPSEPLIIQFRDPAEFFGERYAAALASGGVSGAVVARVGNGHQPPRLPDGSVLGGRMMHMPRDTAWGCVLRTHFFLGYDLPGSGASPERVREMIPDQVGQALLVHAYEEFTILSRYLPSIYAAENRDTVKPVSPWGL